MSDSSDSDPFKDSGFEYVPNDYDTDTESDNSVSSILDADDQQSEAMGNFSVVADPFSIPDKVHDVWGQLTSLHSDQCIESSKVNPNQVKNMLKHIHVPNNEQFHDYIKCIYEKLEMLKPDGTFDEEVILSKAHYLTKDFTKVCLKKAELEQNLSKKSYILCDCVVQGCKMNSGPSTSRCDWKRPLSEHKLREVVANMFSQDDDVDDEVIVSETDDSEIPDNVHDVWGQLIAPHSDQCIESSKVNPNQVKNMLTHVHVPNNEQFHDYIKCIYEKLEMLKPDGTFNEEVILSKAYYLTKDLTKRCLKKAEFEQNLSKKSYILCACVVEGLAVD
ncbi:hypothetical protein RN001_003510 [Aquatica leii]|uniref:Uncharacterized protein n=1 Tax=Aquatica leii TaxID=1421715 RepID=A0AAN7Q6E1_9COLE|nr:hypothetical protein RN001_003510 [Aquatica leii]